MADEPDNLVLELLRVIRGDIADMRSELRGVQDDIRGIRRVQDSHTMRFDFLEEHTERVEKLEKAK